MPRINWNYGPDEVECEIEFSFTPGRAMRMPDLDQPGEPEEPAEVEIWGVYKRNGEAVDQEVFDEIGAEFERGAGLMDTMYDEGWADWHDKCGRDDG